MVENNEDMAAHIDAFDINAELDEEGTTLMVMIKPRGDNTVMHDPALDEHLREVYTVRFPGVKIVTHWLT